MRNANKMSLELNGPFAALDIINRARARAEGTYIEASKFIPSFGNSQLEVKLISH